MTPVTITAKIFIQNLWRVKLDWDENLSESLISQWDRIYAGFAALNSVRIPRWTGCGSTTERVELHGFADASNVAYAAVVYLKSVTGCGKTTVTLLAGKSRVAPIKSLSVPWLELSAAVLLAKLLDFVRQSLPGEPPECCCWTDSSVVLAWVTQHPSRWKPFVANRVADIQTRLPQAEWRYVSTHANPADCASRGILGDELPRHSLWWTGPPWLTRERSHWPNDNCTRADLGSEEKRTTILHCSDKVRSCNLSTRYSSWPKLFRVTAYITRFIRHCRRDYSLSIDSLPHHLSLSANECSQARVWWITKI